MTRKPDWQALLHAFLMEHRSDRFCYGRWDCCLFVCDAICVMTGVDPAVAFRGAYSSRSEARRALRAYGTCSVQDAVEAITSQLDMPEAPVLQARRGDVALVKRGGRDYSLGLVALNGRDIVLASARGLWTIPISSAARAWHV